MRLTARQVEQLLRPIHRDRVLRDAKGHAHVSQQDILAHLIRVFGFCNYDIDVLNVGMVFEESYEKQKKDKEGQSYGDPFTAWDVCYRAMVRLTVKDPDGNELCHYENGSTATAQGQPHRGDAHDLAYKSAISLSVKRAAIPLGDQFGLSLYNRGQMSALVMGTLVVPDPDSAPQTEDLQDGVEKQVSLGNDEIDREDGAA
ncbi:Rad52/Rad22 family DNA repair protein [Nocardia sp. NPDC019255]|uniref:Rad52/Rad22 family DNA repair protein n=1 Tax=Nocardia sp. NPDC019255 TaxID=3154591 RepID=UPI0033F00C9A